MPATLRFGLPLLALALVACDDGIRPDGSLNQCHLGTVTREVGPGEVQDGSLTGLNCRIGASRGMGWALNLAEETRVQIDLMSDDFSPRLILTTRGLVPLGHDDGEEGVVATMWRILPAGEYVVWTTTVLPDQFGNFQLSVQEQEGASCAETVGGLAIPDSVSGTLVPTSCLVPDGTFADPWLLELDAETVVEIDLFTEDFDAYVLVTDMDDTWVAWDEDGSGGSHSHLTADLGPGSYKVWANTVRPGEVGDYELQIRATEEG